MMQMIARILSKIIFRNNYNDKRWKVIVIKWKIFNYYLRNVEITNRRIKNIRKNSTSFILQKFPRIGNKI